MFDRSVFLKNYEDLIFSSLFASTNTKLTAGMYLTGEHYGSTENKLLVVGRALNGWEDTYCWYIHDTHIDIKSTALEIIEAWNEQTNGTKAHDRYSGKIQSAQTKLSPEACRRLEWVRSYYKGKKRSTESSSPFWTLSKKVTNQLLSDHEKDWTKYIAWTNLYKLAPFNGGNPDDELCSLQKDICKNIFQKELNHLAPTHILVIAKKYWKNELAEDGEEQNPHIAKDESDIWTRDFIDILKKYCDESSNRHFVCVSRPEIKATDNSKYIASTIKSAFAIDI